MKYEKQIAAEADILRRKGLTDDDIVRGYKIAYARYEESVMNGGYIPAQIKMRYIEKEAYGILLKERGYVHG